ncbi:unnamed protein product [Mesocestoides corti]|nr:unnamed protein product [Mesocestoides corti]
MNETSTTPRHPCGMVPPVPHFAAANSLAPPHLPPNTSLPSAACPPHPVVMLQWMRSLLVSTQPPPPPPPPPVKPPFPYVAEALQLEDILNTSKAGPLIPGPASTIPLAPPANPFPYDGLDWEHSAQEESEQVRRLRQANYTGHLDAQTIKMYQNFRYSMKVSGHGAPRRKNTTRETTGLLKAWLNEHRKNPYPNKSEKIMLAVITKMSLTQVSTWFANARRRLKKENKATWSLALEQPFPELDEDFPGTSDEIHKSGRFSPPNLVAGCEETTTSEISQTKRPGKIWSVVEMTGEH